MNVRELNMLEDGPAAQVLTDCCAATAWIGGLLAGRPYRDTTSLLAKAEEVWWDLSAEDWQEAFAAEPSPASAPPAFTPLAAEYAATFGYPFVTTSIGADEILEACRHRLGNDPLIELGMAATEMARVVNRRLRQLLDLA